MKKKIIISLILIILFNIPYQYAFASLLNETYFDDGIKTYYVSTEDDITSVLNFIKANMETNVNIVYSGSTIPKSKKNLKYYYLKNTFKNNYLYQDNISLFSNKISQCAGFGIKNVVYSKNNSTVSVTYEFDYYDTEKQSEYNNEELNKAIIDNITNLQTDYDKALWAYLWVIDKLYYDNTLNNFSIYSGLTDNGTVCLGYAALYNALTNKLGLNCRLVEGSVHNNNGNNHAWNIIKLDGKWYAVDSTWGDGDDTHKYFLKSIKTMNSEEYGNHTSDLYDNYIKAGEIFSDTDYNKTIQSEIHPILPSVYSIEMDLLKANILSKEEDYSFMISNPDNIPIYFKSTDETIATVDCEGVITGKNVGTTTITAYNTDLGFEQSCKVEVTE